MPLNAIPMFRPTAVAAAFHLTGTTLRAWANGAIAGQAEPLIFKGDVSQAGHRRYRLADAVLINFVVRQTSSQGFAMATPKALAIANALSAFNEQISQRYWRVGGEPFEAMQRDHPMASVFLENGRINVHGFDTVQDWRRALLPLSTEILTIQMEPLWKATYLMLTRPGVVESDDQ